MAWCAAMDRSCSPIGPDDVSTVHDGGPAASHMVLDGIHTED